MKDSITKKKKKQAGKIIKPTMVTEAMVRLATLRTEDPWHISTALNAMLRHGYCQKCGLVPDACERSGCGRPIPKAPKPRAERMWAVHGIHGLYVGTAFTRQTMIDQHVAALGYDWEHHQRRGDTVIRVTVVPEDKSVKSVPRKKRKQQEGSP